MLDRRVLLRHYSRLQEVIFARTLTAIGVKARLITADTDARSRRRTIREFRTASVTPIILCNYGVLTAGFDAPGTSACVIARPTKSLVLYSQMVGRATRGPVRAETNRVR